MQAIRVETSLGHVEAAVMVMINMDSASSDLRLSAMYHRYPLHTLMFSDDGSLLYANRAALGAFQLSAAGSRLPRLPLSHYSCPVTC